MIDFETGCIFFAFYEESWDWGTCWFGPNEIGDLLNQLQPDAMWAQSIFCFLIWNIGSKCSYFVFNVLASDRFWFEKWVFRTKKNSLVHTTWYNLGKHKKIFIRNISWTGRPPPLPATFRNKNVNFMAKNNVHQNFT